ncbi:MAG TPA: hypothetical protein ENK26_01560 [Gammaproteobacteria bacterium]|nr:hypothetical protein [Gammaproteobacteria bacterium]
MRGMVPPDPLTQVSRECYAVVYVPRRNRKRFSANCVTVYPTLAEALAAADPDNKYFAAEVLGPSKSSEGQYLYYLLRWL